MFTRVCITREGCPDAAGRAVRLRVPTGGRGEGVLAGRLRTVDEGACARRGCGRGRVKRGAAATIQGRCRRPCRRERAAATRIALERGVPGEATRRATRPGDGRRVGGRRCRGRGCGWPRKTVVEDRGGRWRRRERSAVERGAPSSSLEEAGYYRALHGGGGGDQDGHRRAAGKRARGGARGPPVAGGERAEVRLGRRSRQTQTRRGGESSGGSASAVRRGRRPASDPRLPPRRSACGRAVRGEEKPGGAKGSPPWGPPRRGPPPRGPSPRGPPPRGPPPRGQPPRGPPPR